MDSTMRPVTPDAITLIEQMGIKMRAILPRYALHVLGDIHSKNFPDEHQFRQLLHNYLTVHARFNGRDFGTSKPLPKGRDYRATEFEMSEVGAFAQYLINLDAHANTVQTGVKTPAMQLTIDLNLMFKRERILG